MAKDSDKNDHVVIAFFDSPSAAQAGEAALKSWDKADDDIKLGAIGVLTKKDGKLDMHVQRKAGKGAKVGIALGLIAGVLSGGVTLIGGALAGALGGGAIGALMKKSVGLAKEDFDRIGEQLGDGGAALVVVCDEYEVPGTETVLAKAGGKVQKMALSAEAVAEAQQAVDATASAAGVAASEVQAAASGTAATVAAAAGGVAAATKDAAADAGAVAGDSAAAAKDVASDAAAAAKDVTTEATAVAKDAAASVGDAA
jgi:hypothetical protein